MRTRRLTAESRPTRPVCAKVKYYLVFVKYVSCFIDCTDVIAKYYGYDDIFNEINYDYDYFLNIKTDG